MIQIQFSQWAQTDKNPVLVAKYFLNEKAELIGMDMEAVPGEEAKAGAVAYEVGRNTTIANHPEFPIR